MQIKIGLFFICLLGLDLATAFVPMNTSDSVINTNNTDSIEDRIKQDQINSFNLTAPKIPRPHYESVLFFSADDMSIYAQLGILAALEEYGLEPDILLAEGKSSLIAAAWAAGYRTEKIYEWLSHPSLQKYFAPKQLQQTLHHDEPETYYQWDYPFRVQVSESKTTGYGFEFVKAKEQEHLDLAWLIARMTHDGPRGPVEKLDSARRPIALQLSDLDAGEVRVMISGDLQSMVKASSFSQESVFRHRFYWPWASGRFYSGRLPATYLFPFTFRHLVMVEASRALRPPSLGGDDGGWRDSIPAPAPSLPCGKILGFETDLLTLPLVKPSEFSDSSTNPALWYNFGRKAALENMDALTIRVGSIFKKVANDSGSLLTEDELRKPLTLKKSLQQGMISEKRQYLLDVISRSLIDEEDSTGLKTIKKIEQKGVLTDLDVSWNSIADDAEKNIEFSSQEHSLFRFKLGARISNVQGAEAIASLDWIEPFYVPFSSELTGLIGSREKGVKLQCALNPLLPWHLHFGFTGISRNINFSTPNSTEPIQGFDAQKMDERNLVVFTSLLPIWGMLRFEMIREHQWYADKNEVDFDEELFSLDFRTTLSWQISPLQRVEVSQSFLNPENTFPGEGSSGWKIEGRYGTGFPKVIGPMGFESLLQYYYSNYSDENLDRLNWKCASVRAFSFQDDYLHLGLKSTQFSNLRFGLTVQSNLWEIKLRSGTIHYFHSSLDDKYLAGSDQGYWEFNIGRKSPIGDLFAGVGALEGDEPIFHFEIVSAFLLSWEPFWNLLVK